MPFLGLLIRKQWRGAEQCTIYAVAVNSSAHIKYGFKSPKFRYTILRLPQQELPQKWMNQGQLHEVYRL